MELQNVHRETPLRRQRRQQGKSRELIYLVFIVLGVASIPLAKTHAQSTTTYYDDTHVTLESGVGIKVLSGDFGYDRYQFDESADGEPFALDARNARFRVANSANANPTTGFDCNSGSDPVNPYPLNVYHADLTAVVGGLINGEIPQYSDWQPTYCNSAAVHFKYAPSGVVDGVRITSAWDAFRMASDSPNLTVKNSWISNVRDDILENDLFFSTTFEDNLVDGAFQGLSVHSGGDIVNTSSEIVVVRGSVIRIREYLYKGKQQFGALFKNETVSPRSKIYDTVVAVDYKGGSTWSFYWEKSWSKIADCSNNLFLWLSDAPIPDAVPLPPSCFSVVKGEEARAAWANAKKNWIDCHPRLARTANDPDSEPEKCVADTFGGYSQRPSTTIPLPPELHADQ
jgi:hypothetical protein